MITDNVLENWKKECYVFSSEFNIYNITLRRKDVDSIYNIFVDYFGLNYFNRHTLDINNIPNKNHIHSLLVNFKKPASFSALFEIANLLLYTKSLPKSLQKKLKSTIKDSRQFRDLLFETYIQRLLELNNVEVIKKVSEGNQALDGVCILDGEKYLIECKKEYIPNLPFLQTLLRISEALYINIKNKKKGYGLIGTFNLKRKNSPNNKMLFTKKINDFFSKLELENFHTIDYHQVDDDGEMHMIDYSKEKAMEIESNQSLYDLIFKIIPPDNIVPNQLTNYGVKLAFNFHIKETAISEKLLNSLTNKKQQHQTSLYTHKIYFIDSEALVEIESPMPMPLKLLDEDALTKFSQTLSDNELICIVRRDYRYLKPNITLKVIGNNINKDIKQKLESLKTDFDFSIQLN